MSLHRCYWWRAKPNMGDELGPLLLKHLSGVDVEWAMPAEADVICAGSTLDVLPQVGWRGVVVGSGKLHEHTHTDLSQARVLGLRGLLTAQDVTYNGTPVIGDPGLLAHKLPVKPKANRYPLGLVAHVSDTDRGLYQRFADRNPQEINVGDDPLAVVEQIGSCSEIIASSLHGLIVADAFGLPRQLEPFVHHNRFEGKTYKFRDYLSIYGEALEYGVMRSAPSDMRCRVQIELERMFADMVPSSAVPSSTQSKESKHGEQSS